ncbi:unnamed protein product [Lota lota]
MELKLEVVLSSSIKRKKPWPRFCWLGQEKEAVFLLDDNRISEINMVTGRTKKKTPKIHPLLNSVVTMAASQTGVWLAGLLVSGELFLWNRDKDWLKTASAVPEVAHLIATVKGNAPRVALHISGDGMRVVLTAVTGHVYLWECADVKDLTGVRDGAIRGRWAHIQPAEDAALPSLKDKEASQQGIFVKNEAVGDVFLSAWVFTSGDKLSITFLKVQWEEVLAREVCCVDYSVKWATKTYPMPSLTPPCKPVKSRGALVLALSPDGRLLAVALNQKDPRATQVLFVSTQNFVSIARGLGGCGSKNLTIPSKYLRSYWVGSVSWSPTGLFLACVLKRGSLLMLARLGGLLSLSSSGCNVDFGPAHFLPLHPLVTYRPPESSRRAEASLSSSSMSFWDVLRQRFSVTWHPRLFYLIVSDGYMVTVLRLLEKATPALLMTALLQEASKDMESTIQRLEKTQKEDMDPSVTSGPNTLHSKAPSPAHASSLPLFLQDQGTMSDTRELLHKAQACLAFFEDDSDVDVRAAVSHAEDGGVLEFASMFDTLHARSDPQLAGSPGGPADPEDDQRTTWDFSSATGSEKKSSWSLRTLVGVKVHLLTAWALGLSLGGAAEEHQYLLTLTVRFVLRLAALLHYTASTTASAGHTGTINICSSSRVSQLFSAFLVFLSWDAFHPGAQSRLGSVVELTQKLAHLLLSPLPDALPRGRSGSQLSSQSISSTLRVVRQASDSLDHAYILQQRQVWASAPQESRVWQWLYSLTQRYMDELKGYTGCDGWAEEQQQASVVLSQIQECLQGTGVKLEDGPALLSCQGERHFLFGSYSESADAWRSEMWTERNISEAQCESWLPADLHRDAARAVVQTLGRFMASYFTNQPLCILPPHNVELLPPLHLPHAPCVGRLVPLCQERVTRAVREQHVSDVWTVDYAQDLLLIGGLLPEAVWLADRLGDWKTAASLSLAYTSYRDEHFPGVKLRELHFPAALKPGSIFQDQLHSLLGRNAGSNETEGACSSEWSEGEDWDILQGSVQEILKASVMAGVDVVSGLLSDLMESAKALASCLPALVPQGLYLPAPPLYCPQPASNTQDPVGTWGRVSEVSSRHQVSSVLQRLLLLLRSARCCRPAAQWYISHLRRARHIQHKIKKRYGHPCAAEEEGAFPESLVKLVTRAGFFRKGPNRDGQLDPVTIQTISCFRDLCGLCWLLHVRDQLSVSCRKYQAARHAQRDAQEYDDSEMSSSCVEAVHWACRLLPFSRFLNAEEILQDILLSLVSELPPLSMVADTLVRAFPAEEESVRVPLREKYHSLLERLKHCTVLGDTGEASSEVMMVTLQDKRRQRRKDLQRLQRHLAPPQLFLWEREEEEDNRGGGGAGAGGAGGGGRGTSLPGRLSLGTSLSTSTLTDRGQPMVNSDGDTAENTSEALFTDLPPRTTASKRVQDGVKAKKAPSKTNKVLWVERDGGPGPSRQPEGPQREPDRPALPAVGTWEFELDDEEYLPFLELFLSYVLEKDSSESSGAEDGCELPLLQGFTSPLRERELHSLTFDVLSTLRRRQRDGGHAGRKPPGTGPDAPRPVFRAGHCYRPATVPELTRSEPRSSLVWSETPEKPVSRRTQPSVALLPGLTPGRQQGLFGLQQQQYQKATTAPESSTKGSSVRSAPSPRQSAVPWENLSEDLTFGSPVSTEILADLQHGLDSKLEAQFPELGRLLEWMVRWANRRTPLGNHGIMMKKKKSGPEDGGTSDGGVVIRVKASTPAVLTALSLLEHRCSSAPPRVDPSTGPTWTRVAEPHISSVLVLLPKAGWKQEGEGSVDTGYPGSTNTPVTLPDHQLMPEDPSFGSEEEPETGASQNTPDHTVQEPVTYDSEMGTMTSQHPSLCDHAAPEEEVKGAQDGPAPPRPSGWSAPLTISAPDDPPHPQPSESSRTTAPPPVAMVTNDTPAPQAEPLRHFVNDELFRLVQLQQINFMSLMHMVGSTFASLPYVQLAQSNTPLSHPSAAQPAPFPLSQPNTLFPSVYTNTSEHLQTQAGVPLRSERSDALPNLASTYKPSAGPDPDRPPDQPSTSRNHPGNVDSAELMQPLLVQAEPPGSPHGESRRRIPTSQGLLTTLDCDEPLPSIPVPLPTDLNTTNHATSSLLLPGLKLLRLPPLPDSPVRQAWGPQPPNIGLPHPDPGACDDDQAASFWAKKEEEEEEEEEEEVLFASPAHHSQYSATGSARKRTRASGPYSRTSQRAEFPSLPHPDLLAHGAPPGPGLRLLSCHSPPAPTPTAFPLVSQPSTHRPVTTLIPAFSRPPPPPTIQLLYIDPEPRTLFPQSTPAPEINYVDLLQDLRRLDPRRTTAGQTGLQLIVVNPQPENQSGATVPDVSPSSRKTRSRKDRAKTGEKVTFRPDESIIPTHEVADLPGPLDPLLTGQRLLNKAFATSAELHAYASTHKSPPESHDACTNTDPAGPSKLVDKAVSAIASNPESQRPAVVLPPEVLMNQWLPRKTPVRDTEETQKRPQQNQDSPGRRFLNVVDLEEESLLRDLAPGSCRRSQQDTQHPTPSSAQLHLIAASVVSNAAAEPRTSDTPTGEIPETVTQPDLPHHPLVRSTGDPVTDALLQGRPGPSHTGRAPESQSPGPLGASTGPQAAHFSSCLTEMDAQLAALQSIADHMETEFVNSRMLVRTIDTLTHVAAQGPDSKMTQSKTVSLFIPDKGSHSVQPSYPYKLADSSLGFSGLSDMTDILGELVREGALSLSDLEVSHAQAARLHRLQHQQQLQRADLSLRSCAADDRESRKELRTWMRRKQRERQASYQKQREEMRQREHRPFASAKTLNSTFTYQTAVKKIKEDKEKVMLLEQYNQRTREASLLVSDLPQAHFTVRSTARTGSALPPSSIQPPTAHISASSKPRNSTPKVQSRPSQPLFYPWEQSEKHRWRSPLENQQRFGLHRPVSALPKDRLSQVTRRGMISEARGRATPHGPANQSRPPHREGPIKSGMNRSPSRVASAGRRERREEMEREEMKREENEASSTWNPPLEISRLLDMKEPKTGVAGLSEDEEEAEEEGTAEMSWLEKLSDTDTSNISRIDWAEIERLVATEEI